MDDFQRYLDLYTPANQVLRAALDGRLAPSSHYERFFNPPFPELRTGLNGLAAVGEPLPRPSAATLPDGFVAPPPAWLQRALNALAAVGGSSERISVDGVAGPVTLTAVRALWTGLARVTGNAPYLATVSGVRTVAMDRRLLQWIVDQNLIEVSGPSAQPSTQVPVSPPPVPSTSSGAGGILLVAAAVAAGLWFVRP